MLIYKIFRAPEWAELRENGETQGAPIDRVDGYIHFSTGAQAPDTASRHFAGEDGLIIVACDSRKMGPELRWEISRGGAEFPHLFRNLTLDDVLWDAPLPLIDGRHHFPKEVE